MANRPRDFFPFCAALSRRRSGPPQIAGGGGQGSAQQLSARFSATKNPDGERPAFWETGFRRFYAELVVFFIL